MTPPTPLSRDRVLRAAIALADEHGIGALTMRRLGQSLGVEAMSLYKHVAGKDDILDGIVDRVFAEIDLPDDAPDWKTAMRARATSARDAFTRHPWAVPIMDSRLSPGPATLRHHDWVIGRLRAGGFAIPMAAHAFAVLDAFVFGFAVQEASLPFDTSNEATDVAGSALRDVTPDRYPHLVALATEHVMKPGYAFSDEFAFGLELILDGLERARDSA